MIGNEGEIIWFVPSFQLVSNLTKTHFANPSTFKADSISRVLIGQRRTRREKSSELSLSRPKAFLSARARGGGAQGSAGEGGRDRGDDDDVDGDLRGDIITVGGDEPVAARPAVVYHHDGAPVQQLADVVVARRWTWAGTRTRTCLLGRVAAPRWRWR